MLEIKHEDIVKSAIINSEATKNGVYFLIHEGRVVYVGQSVNIYSRVSQHANVIVHDSFNYILVDIRKKLDNIEAYFISKYRPQYNLKMQRNTIGLTNEHLKSTKPIPDYTYSLVLKEYGDAFTSQIKKDPIINVLRPKPTEEYDYNLVKLNELENTVKNLSQIIFDTNKKLNILELKLIKSDENLNIAKKEIEYLNMCEVVNNKFKMPLENWNQQIKGIFGIVINDIVEEPFFLISSNNPVQILSEIRNGKLPSLAKVMVDLNDFFIKQNILDKLNIKLIEFDTGQFKELTYKMESTALNNNFHRSEKYTEIRNNIVSKIKFNIITYNNI